MLSPKFPFRGVIPIVSMPFLPTGEIDEEGLRHEVAWAIDAGAHGIGVGLATELSRLTWTERLCVTRVISDEVRGRVPLIVQVGGEATEVCINLAHHAVAVGADAVMVPPPTFQVGDFESILTFFRGLAAATSAPLILQDLAGARVTPDLVRILAEDFPDRIAVKVESSPSPLAVARFVAATEHLSVPVFGGNGGLHFLSEHLRGAVGTMPGCGLTDYFVAVVRKLASDRVKDARRLFSSMQPLLALITLSEFVIPMHRQLLVLREVLSFSTSRSPTLALSNVDLAELELLWTELAKVPVRH